MRPPARFKVYRVLLVEDDEQYAKFLLTALHRFNFFVRYAGDGRFALKFLKEEPFDLMLCDISMPHMDGFKLLEKAQAQRLKIPPLIMITGHRDKENVLKAGAFGAVGYITKPTALEQLLSKIKEVLGLVEAQLLDKTTVPFRVSCTKSDGYWVVELSGCPLKDPLSEIKKTITEAPPRVSRANEVVIQIAPEFACEGRAVSILHDLARHLNKQLRIPWSSIRFKGKFFGAISLLDKEKFAQEHVVVEA